MLRLAMVVARLPRGRAPASTSSVGRCVFFVLSRGLLPAPMRGGLGRRGRTEGEHAQGGESVRALEPRWRGVVRALVRLHAVSAAAAARAEGGCGPWWRRRWGSDGCWRQLLLAAGVECRGLFPCWSVVCPGWPLGLGRMRASLPGDLLCSCVADLCFVSSSRRLPYHILFAISRSVCPALLATCPSCVCASCAHTHALFSFAD